MAQREIRNTKLHSRDVIKLLHISCSYVNALFSFELGRQYFPLLVSARHIQWLKLRKISVNRSSIIDLCVRPLATTLQVALHHTLQKEISSHHWQYRFVTLIFFPFVSEFEACIDAIVTPTIDIYATPSNSVIDQRWFAFVCMYAANVLESKLQFITSEDVTFKLHKKKTYEQQMVITKDQIAELQGGNQTSEGGCG